MWVVENSVGVVIKGDGKRVEVRALWDRNLREGELTKGGKWELGGTKLEPGLSFTEGWLWIKKVTRVTEPIIKVNKKRKRASPSKLKEKSRFDQENNYKDSEFSC